MSLSMRGPRAQPSSAQYRRIGNVLASSKDSVTSVPSLASYSTYDHVSWTVLRGAIGKPNGRELTSKANLRIGSQAMTMHTVQYTGPFSLRLT